MKNEFTLAFNEVLEEKGLPQEVILNALENAMVSAYRKAVNASTAQEVEAKVDLETGKVTISAEKEVVEDVMEDLTEVTLERGARGQSRSPTGRYGDRGMHPGGFWPRGRPDRPPGDPAAHPRRRTLRRS